MKKWLVLLLILVVVGILYTADESSWKYAKGDKLAWADPETKEFKEELGVVIDRGVFKFSDGSSRVGYKVLLSKNNY